MQVLITSPSYDKGTYYLHAWSESLVREFSGKSVTIKHLEKDKINKRYFHNYLRKQAFDVVVINGHGNEIAVAGNSNSHIILSINDGDDLFRDKIVYIRACNCGAVLGPELINKGAKGFIGYSQPFFIPHDRDAGSDPLKDSYAAPILECSNQVITSLIKGHSVEETERESMKKYEEIFDRYSSSRTAESFILPFLLWNMDFQVHLS